MRRERVLRDFQQAGEITGCKAIRFVPDQGPKGLETGCLGKGRERQDCLFCFHISRFIEIFSRVNRFQALTGRPADISNILEISLTVPFASRILYR